MIREIKFRFWTGSDMRYKFDGWGEHVCINEMFKECVDHFDYAVMQYTGLKDKNGKEIYEGDVVEFLYKNPESKEKLAPVRCVILWCDEGAWALKWPDGYINGARLQPKKYTVIGNIHENPKLLN